MAPVRYNIFDLTWKRVITLLSTVSLFALAIWFLNEVLPYRHVWDRFYTEDKIKVFFCEKTYMDKIVRQPVNTFTNFIYWVSAFAILMRGWKDQSSNKRYNIVSANPFYSISFGLMLLYTFVASTFFHSSLIHFASRLDFSAVYFMVLFPLMYFVHRIWLLSIGVPSNVRHSKSTTTIITLFALIYIALTAFVPNGMDDYVILSIILVMIVFGVIVERKDRGRTTHRYLAISIGCILLAVVCFGCDIRKVFCNPNSFLQPHSLWHLFSGIAAFYFYMYIRSERNKI